MKKYFLIIGILFLIPFLRASSVIEVIPPVDNTQCRYYNISGRNYDELCKEIFDLKNGKGSLNHVENKRYAACANKRYNWNADFDEQKSYVRWKNIKVTVNVTLLFPLWYAPENADKAMVTRWEKFIEGVHIHECGHAQIYNDMLNDLKTTMENLKASNKEELKQQTSAAYNAFLDKVYTRDEQYEISTNHGKTQGALF